MPVIVASEESAQITPYQPPEPKMKILKRPQSSPSNLSSQGGSGGVNQANGGKAKTTKSLKEREEEYAQARLRILGSAVNPDEEAEVNKSEENIVIQKVNDDNGKTRDPKGPDGTKGFQKK